MKTAALIIGILGVAAYLLCFQLKGAKRILGCRLLSNALFVTQYLLLGAFVGAGMDITTCITSFFSYKKDVPFIARHKTAFTVITSLAVLTVGGLLCKDAFGLLSIAGALLENIAGWMKKDKMIRIVTLFSAPCWLAYNVISGAYGSAVGSVLAMLSIIVALIRYSSKKETSARG
jgi:hypothetical protein